jgi:hypothetical protein
MTDTSPEAGYFTPNGTFVQRCFEFCIPTASLPHVVGVNKEQLWIWNQLVPYDLIIIPRPLRTRTQPKHHRLYGVKGATGITAIAAPTASRNRDDDDADEDVIWLQFMAADMHDTIGTTICNGIERRVAEWQQLNNIAATIMAPTATATASVPITSSTTSSTYNYDASHAVYGRAAMLLMDHYELLRYLRGTCRCILNCDIFELNKHILTRDAPASSPIDRYDNAPAHPHTSS